MNNNKNQEAAKAARKTRPFWGVVAIAGVFVAGTIDGSVAVSLIGAAMFGLGAWLGGYMEPIGEEGGKL